MISISLIDYYKHFVRTYGIIVLIVGGLPFLSLLPIEPLTSLSGYLFPPLGSSTNLIRFMTVVLVGLITVVVFFQKERKVVKGNKGGANFFLAFFIITLISLISFSIFAQLFVIAIDSTQGAVYFTRGYDYNADIDTEVEDKDLIKERGSGDNVSEEIWTRDSLFIARSVLYLSYLLTILSIVALCSFAVLFDLSAAVPDTDTLPRGIRDQNIVNEEIPVKKILFVMANPTDTTRLRLNTEFREVDNGLRLSSLRDDFELEISGATRPTDLRRQMLRYSPQFVHFSGHGETEGIILEDENGNAKTVGTESLAGLFSLFSDTTECVILNSCYSEHQAKAIHKHIPFVIGMNKAVPDAAAIQFAIGFYDAIGAGRSVENAFEFGKNAIDLNSIEGKDIPILMKK